MRPQSSDGVLSIALYALPYMRASLLSNLWQILHPCQPISAGECQCLVCALRLSHTENAMATGVVDFYVIAVFDGQSPRKHRVPKVILCAD